MADEHRYTGYAGNGFGDLAKSLRPTEGRQFTPESKRAQQGIADLVKSMPEAGALTWGNYACDVLAHAVSLGDEKVHSAVLADAQVRQAIRTGELNTSLQKSASARGGFLAELLSLALENASDAMEKNSMAPQQIEVKTVCETLEKNLSAVGCDWAGLEQRSEGRRLARVAWKVIEPRVAWARAA